MKTAARIVLGPSVMRVFEQGTTRRLLPVLERTNIPQLRRVTTQARYKRWFERNLERVAKAIEASNRRNTRIRPGLKWGHATKILCLFVREIVLRTRLLTDAEVTRLERFLYVPLDSVVRRELRGCGINLPGTGIKHICRPNHFYNAQDRMAEAAERAGVPRICFDDVWANRE